MQIRLPNTRIQLWGDNLANYMNDVIETRIHLFVGHLGVPETTL